jgi:hypothetical protein
MKPTIAIIVFAVLLCSGCTMSSASVEPFVDTSVTATDLEFTGTVVFIEIEGGFFALRTDAGTTYEPVNLPERFAVNKMPVRVTARTRADLGSYRMVGPIIEIRTMETP